MIEANTDLAGLTHTPQSVLRVVDKVPFGGVVMILEALPPTLAAHAGRASHTLKLQLGESGVPSTLGGCTSAAVAHDDRHPTVRVPSPTT